MSEGLILWGVKSIYTVLDLKDNKEYECRIKGKIIGLTNNIKNRKDISPIVSGDLVKFEISTEAQGLISKRLDRKNEILRLKNGGREIQTLAANIDLLVIVDSVLNPPIRPFFIDRCIFSADLMHIPVLIVFNKSDLLNDNEEIANKLLTESTNAYNKIGIKTILTSINTNDGIEILNNELKGKLSNFIGRSGVGKSSLLKKLSNDKIDLRIGEVSKKFDRGTHTTNFSRIYCMEDKKIIDTPGIREFSIFIDDPKEVQGYFKDFDGFREKCRYPNCQHISEPGCAVLKGLEQDEITLFRYESYLRIRETIEKIKDSKI